RQVELDEVAAQAMPDHHRTRADRLDRLCQIAQIIAHTDQIDRARPVAPAMSAPADRVNLEAARGEINHRVMPAPCAVPGAVDQQQRCSVASVAGAEDRVLELWHCLSVKNVKRKT